MSLGTYFIFYLVKLIVYYHIKAIIFILKNDFDVNYVGEIEIN